MTQNPCPCCSELLYEECCKPFHDGVLAPSALLLMRSRYCAYALNKADYIMKTTHPKNINHLEDKTFWKQSISLFSTETIFKRLEIHEFKEVKNTAFVIFTASLTQNMQDATFTEKSYFEKIGNEWLYLNGEMIRN